LLLSKKQKPAFRRALLRGIFGRGSRGAIGKRSEMNLKEGIHSWIGLVSRKPLLVIIGRCRNTGKVALRIRFTEIDCAHPARPPKERTLPVWLATLTKG
jgi:hypothetical protein